jgi:hypothetical protein
MMTLMETVMLFPCEDRMGLAGWLVHRKSGKATGLPGRRAQTTAGPSRQRSKSPNQPMLPDSGDLVRN